MAEKELCRVPGCRRPLKSRGLCKRHGVALYTHPGRGKRGREAVEYALPARWKRAPLGEAKQVASAPGATGAGTQPPPAADGPPWRCRRKDREGRGCVKPVGHPGRCRVRDRGHPEFPSLNQISVAVAAKLDDPGLADRAGGPGSRGRGSVAAAMHDLAEAVGEVSAQAEGLIADLNAAMGRMSARVADARAKALATLKSLVRSRREVMSLLAERHKAAAQPADQGETAEDPEP